MVQETRTLAASDVEKQQPSEEISENDSSISLNDTKKDADPAPDTSLPRDATEEEIASLPHVTDKIPFAAWAVIIAGAGERFTYFGLITPWRRCLPNKLSFLESAVI